MALEFLCQCLAKRPQRTTSILYVDGDSVCFIVEDAVREIPGQPGEQWKVDGITAIPAGRYKVTLENSGRFGPETITLTSIDGKEPGDVGFRSDGTPLFKYIRVHSGNDETHTEGCPIAGNKLTDAGTIVAGNTRSAVADLKRRVRAALSKGDEVFWTVDRKNAT